MLLVTLLYMAILFVSGNPEWRPIVAGYLGLLLLGGCFISVGLLISSLTKNQIVAGVITFAVVPDAVDHQLARRTSRARRMRAVLIAPLDHRPLRRLRAGASSTPSTSSTT